MLGQYSGHRLNNTITINLCQLDQWCAGDDRVERRPFDTAIALITKSSFYVNNSASYFAAWTWHLACLAWVMLGTQNMLLQLEAGRVFWGYPSIAERYTFVGKRPQSRKTIVLSRVKHTFAASTLPSRNAFIRSYVWRRFWLKAKREKAICELISFATCRLVCRVW